MQKESKQEVIENQQAQNQMKPMLQTMRNMKSLPSKNRFNPLQNMNNTEQRQKQKREKFRLKNKWFLTRKNHRNLRKEISLNIDSKQSNARFNKTSNINS